MVNRRSQAQESILHDSICTKFNAGEIESVVLEVRTVVILGGLVPGRGHERDLGG